MSLSPTLTPTLSQWKREIICLRIIAYRKLTLLTYFLESQPKIIDAA
jgi:hypothetical protein